MIVNGSIKMNLKEVKIKINTITATALNENELFLYKLLYKNKFLIFILRMCSPFIFTHFDVQ